MKPIFEDKKSGVYISRVKSFSFPEHMHTLVEAAYVFSGQMGALISGREYALSAGDFVIAFSNVPHGYVCRSEHEALIAIFPAEISQDFGRQLLTSAPRNPVISRCEMAFEVGETARALVRERDNNCAEALLKAYLQVILARVMPQLSLAALPVAEADVVHRIMGYISAHFDEPITLDSLSRELGVNKYHLSHIISEKMRVNFREYVNALRIDRARMLLRGTDWQITRVCFECGFENQRTFNRAFMNTCGTTPSEFRRG